MSGAKVIPIRVCEWHPDGRDCARYGYMCRNRRAPVGSLRWQLGLLGATLLGGAIALCPVWWAVALWWEIKARRKAAA